MPILLAVASRALLAAALLAAAGLPQGPAAPPTVDATAAPASLAWPTDRVLTDTTHDGAVWAATAGWKACFAADGATFMPFLGSLVPSRSATFRLAEARLGGQLLQLEAVTPTQSAQRITFERGSVVEFYDLRQDGIEQQFLLHELPNRGELRLAVAVSTDLEVRRAGDGFTLTCAEGGIHYGKATAIDAAGRRLDLLTEWTGGAMQITVPAGFVASAELPLRIDPMIGSSNSFSPSAAELTSTDIAYDHSLGQYYVCYERAFSATDHDVYVSCLDTSLQPVVLLTIDFTGQYWSKPRVATLEAHDVGCVVAETSTGNVSPFWVRSRRFYGGPTPTVAANIVLLNASSLDYLEPSIGGDDGPSGTGQFLYAWTSRSTINGTSSIRLMNSDGNGLTYFVATITLPTANAVRPAISKTCGRGGGANPGWAVVFRGDALGSTIGAVHAAIVDQAGPSLRQFSGQSYFTLTASSPDLGSAVCVSSPTDQNLGRQFLCAERHYDPINLRGSLVGHVFDRNANVVQTGITLNGGTNNHLQPAVDCDGSRFAVVHATRLTATDADLRCLTFGMVGNQLVQQDSAVPSYSLDYDANPAVCAVRGTQHNLYALAWTREATGGGFTGQSQFYRGVAAGGVVSRATGCGGMGISALGAPALGEAVTFSLGNLGGLLGFVAGLPMSVPIGACPGCTQGVSGSVVLGMSLVVSVPLSVGLVGTTFAVQGFHFAPSGEPCLGQLEFSNTFDFTIQ